MMKGAVYILTIVLLVYVCYCEKKLENRLVDANDPGTKFIETSILAEQFRRARVLRDVPREHKAKLTKFRTVRGVLSLLFILEFILFQR